MIGLSGRYRLRQTTGIITLIVSLAGLATVSCNRQGLSEEEAAAVEVVKSTLADPGSAVFENIRTGRHGLVCGEVNAKNQFGGYAGLQSFYVLMTDPKGRLGAKYASLSRGGRPRAIVANPIRADYPNVYWLYPNSSTASAMGAQRSWEATYAEVCPPQASTN